MADFGITQTGFKMTKYWAPVLSVSGEIGLFQGHGIGIFLKVPLGILLSAYVSVIYCYITNYHMLSSLKQQLFFTIAEGQKSEHSLARNSARGLSQTATGCQQDWGLI